MEVKEKRMASIDYQVSDWHGRRQNTSDQQSTQESPIGMLNPGPSFSRSISSARGLGSSANSSVRASAMHSMHRTHGNRAVQRAVQRQVASEEVPVQRFWDSVSDWFGGGGSGGGSGPFYNPTPPMPQMPSSGPFYNPTPTMPGLPGITAPGPLPLGQPFTGGPAFEEYLKSIAGKEPAKPGERPRGHAF